MRPYKHAAPSQDTGVRTRTQEVLDVALTRFRAPSGEVPVVATTELDRITILYWNDPERRWSSIERPHFELRSDGSTPDAVLSWNWSDRVGLTSSRDTVFAVYKREPRDLSGPARLIVDRFRVVEGSGAGRLERVDTQTVGTLGLGTSPLGRSLWCHFDDARDTLLILCQVFTTPGFGFDEPPTWRLLLLRVGFGGAELAVTSTDIGEGGFDLDARAAGSELIVVYRRTAEALRVPLALMLGGGTLVGSGPPHDALYTPLDLIRVDLESTSVIASEQIPGGEHPQIQRTDPLLITMDRWRVAALRLDTAVIPLPPTQPHPIWSGLTVDKIAWLRSAEGDARGAILSFDAARWPRSLAVFPDALHLFDVRGGVMAHAMAFRTCPVSVLAVTVSRKDLVLDVLHHREEVGLFRTRVAATIGDGEIVVSGSAFEVWDIGHSQIGDPAQVVPDVTGENAQFAPSAALPMTRSTAVGLRPERADNTIGGNLVADLLHEPIDFFAYTDFGDGGLRVIFSPDIPALADPPPVENEKILRPEQVTGPHLTCEEWIELRAADYVASGLPEYFVGLLAGAASLGSSREVAIDSLDDAAAQVQRPDGTVPNRLNGLSDRDLDDLDGVRLQATPPREVTLTASDGRVIVVTVTPGAPVDHHPFTVFAAVDVPPTAVQWTFARVAPPGAPVEPGAGVPFPATGNPAAVVLPVADSWQMNLLLLDSTPPARAEGVIDVGESFRELVWGIPKELYDRVEVERLHASFLQYDVEYRTPADQERTVVIQRARERSTELKFGGADSPGQGVVDYRETFAIDIPGSGGGATVGRVRGFLGLLDVKELFLAFAYGRAFTTGMLMRDQRFANVLTQEVGDVPGDVVRRDEPLRHAAIGGKPVGDASTSEPEVRVRLETNLLNAVLTAIVAGLVIYGLAALASFIASLYGLIAAASVLGPTGVIVGAAAAVLLFVVLVFWVPREVENRVRGGVAASFARSDPRDALNRAGLLLFAGEGMAEAIARKALEAAIEGGHDVRPPASEPEPRGFDRFRGQTFQMVFVSDGVCRILIRPDDCP